LLVGVGLSGGAVAAGRRSGGGRVTRVAYGVARATPHLSSTAMDCSDQKWTSAFDVKSLL
jgi:hypothetical protein